MRNAGGNQAVTHLHQAFSYLQISPFLIRPCFRSATYLSRSACPRQATYYDSLRAAPPPGEGIMGAEIYAQLNDHLPHGKKRSSLAATPLQLQNSLSSLHTKGRPNHRECLRIVYRAQCRYQGHLLLGRIPNHILCNNISSP